MKPYAISRPDGNHTGIWACGKCDRLHYGIISGLFGAPVSAPNRKQAEGCCEPETCSLCGAFIRLRNSGDYSEYVKHGVGRCVPDPDPDRYKPHPSMTPEAEALASIMSDISEECWCAGWMTGNEFALWRIVSSGVAADYGQGTVTLADIERLKRLSDKAGGWIRWIEGGCGRECLPMTEWLPLFRRAGGEAVTDEQAVGVPQVSAHALKDKS